MLAAALRDGTAHRRTTFEVFARRLPDGRRYGVVAGTARFVEALAQFRFDDDALASLSDFLDADTLGVPGRLPFRGDVDGYAEGELYFPGSPVLSVHGTLRRMRRAGDAGAVDLQPRHRDRVGRGAHGQRGRRPPADRDGFAAHPRAGRRRRGARRLPRRLRRHVEPRGRSAATACPRWAPARTRSRCCTPPPTGPDEKAAFRAQVDALGVGTTLLVDTYDITAGRGQRRRGGGHRARRGAHRLRRSGRAGPPGPRTARRPRRHRDPHRGVRRPRRVRDRGAARRTGRHLRRRHVGGHRLGRPDRQHGLQAGRGRRHPGREAQQPQGVPRRPQAGAAAGQAVRHHRRGGRPPAGRAAAGPGRPDRARPDGPAGARTANRSRDLEPRRGPRARRRPGCTACRGTA